MKIHFDKEKLQKALADFNNCTKMTVTLFDRELNCITDVGTWQPYCLAIGEKAERLAQCNGCNRENAVKSLNKRGVLMYTCHAGVAEAVIPIFQNDTFVAYLMIGKFRDAEEEYSSAQLVTEAAEKYGLDKDMMLKTYYELPVLDKTCIASAISLLEMLIYYITNEKIVHYDYSVQFEAINNYIENHIGEKITVSDIANRFRIPRHLLYAMFQSEAGEPIQEYIIKKRINNARKLLVNTSLPIRQIAVEVGYPEDNYFLRIFKERTGVTPLQYRKQFKK